jgi:DNA-binding CsgD family transcriptional regulator
MRRGGPFAAFRAYRRAAELSTDAERGAERLYHGAKALWDGGYPELALSVADEALIATSDSLLRADIVILRGEAEIWLGRATRAFDQLMSEAERIEAADATRATDLLSRAAVACFTSGAMAKAVEVGERAYATGQRAGGTAFIAGQAALAAACAFAGDGERSKALGEPIVALAEGLSDVPETRDLMQLGALVAMLAEQYDRSRRLLNTLLQTAESADRGGLVPFAVTLLAEVDLRGGRWSDAYSHAVASERHCREYGHLWGVTFASIITARLQAAWGLGDEARRRCAEALEFGRRHDLESFRLLGRSVLGFLELSLGNSQAAVDSLVEAAEIAARSGAGNAMATRFGPDLVECLLRLDRREEAERHLETLEEQARAGGQAWSIGAAQRCRGLLSSDDDELETFFEEALRLHNASGQPFEVARTQLCFGEQLRRVRRRSEAREQLRAALETFDRLRAEPWARRARTELEATGLSARSRTPGDMRRLTPQELHVAVLVARGATNREAAAELFLSPKTVEKHLGSVYRKLGIRSRAELARAVVMDGLEAPAEEGFAETRSPQLG